MKILVLNWRDMKHPLSGGAEVSLLEHVKYWQKKGADITWFSSGFKSAKKEEIIDGIKFIRAGSHYTVHFQAFLYLLQNKKQFDLIVDNFHFIPFFTPLYVRKTKILAFIHEIAGKVWYKNLPILPAFFGFHAEPLFFRIYKKIPFLTVSKSTRDELVNLGISSENISVIHNGVSRTVLVSEEKNSKPAVIYLGRISYDKGIQDALDAFEDINMNIPEIEFWIVGKEEEKGMFDLLIKDHNKIVNNVKYWGYVTEQEKFTLLRKAWVLIHPSMKEGWGLTVIEAATQGTPTVAYNVEGLRDSIKNNQTGILVDHSIDDLAHAVERLINNTQELKLLSKNAEKYAEQFDWEKSGEQSWEVINSL